MNENALLPSHVDIAVIGSGFSGLAMAQRLLSAGMSDFVVLERADDVGGTWRDNSYPGCACDVPSHLYSFSFAPNPEWSSTCSPAPEIWAYLRKTAEQHGLLPHVRFGAALEDATWDEDEGHWRLRTARGGLTARVLVTAVGGLSDPSIPSLPGLESFRGAVFHSATWDHDHDLTGERVAVVGTGASAIQFVPEIQPAVRELHLFQRTPPWVMPRRARPFSKVERSLYRRVPAAQRLMRDAIYWARELYALPMLHAPLSRIVRGLAKAHMAKQVPDHDLREKLTPDYAPGCKRILISNDYLRSLTQPNVEVVTDAVAEVREHSVVARDGTEREVDSIVFGTGFHVTDMPVAHKVCGREGRTLAEAWEPSMHAHRGTAIPGFPNLFMLLGPNTGLGHTSVVVMAEAQADYVLGALRHMQAVDCHALEVRAEAERTWNEGVQKRMHGTVWNLGGCASWYMDSHGKNTTLWPDFTFTFRRLLRRFDAESYDVVEAPVPAAAVREEVAA